MKVLSQTPILVLIVVAIAGVSIAIQAPINAALGKAIGSSTTAAAVSFGVGFIVLCLVSVIVGDSGSFLRLQTVSFGLLAGGVFGAFYVWSALWGVTSLGVLSTVSALVLGQLVAALVLDYFGPFGLPTHEISASRMLAACLVASGLVLSRY